MGANLCTLSGSSLKDCIKPKTNYLKTQNRTKSTKTNFKRKTEKNKKLGVQEDWILTSQEMKQSKKKVHPCSTQFRGGGSLISELAQDSLCLIERKTKNRVEEVIDEELTSDCSLITTSNICGTSMKKKRVRFNLPHTVIFYQPDDPYCKEEEEEEETSFSSHKCREEYSFDTTEEPFLRLAVDVLPHVIFVSSKVSK